MIRTHRRGVVVALVLAVGLLGAACGSDDDDDGGGKAGSDEDRTIVVGSAPFSESLILGQMYAKALRGAGFKVALKGGLGNRELYEPALERGGKRDGIDLVPEYVGTLLEFLNKNAGEASGDLNATVDKLRGRLKAKNLSALEASPAADQNAFAVTRATADKRKFTKLSDLAPVGDQLTLGGPPECPARPFCLPGLLKTYGITFKSFRVLDAGGPKTKEALDSGDIDVGLVFSSDGAVAARDLVVLEDDKHLQTVDNVIPVLRNDVLSDKVKNVLNRISAALTTNDLIALNKRADIDKEDPEQLAEEWLKSKGIETG